jgi:hypothetical protein
MDKVKVVLEKLKKHHFWVICAVVLLTSLIGWYSASAALSSQFTTNATKIKGEFGELDAVTNNGKQANQTTTEAVVKKSEEQKEKVLSVWDRAYSEQKKEVLKWPTVVSKLDSMGPAEEIDSNTRELYRNFLDEEFPRLVKMVGARTAEEEEQEKAASKVAIPKRQGDEKAVVPQAAPKKYKVVWDSANRDQIRKGLQFAGTLPSTKEMRQTQEDLWVYTALVRIIAAVNKDAAQHYQAPIKRIAEIAISGNAAKHFAEGVSSNRVFRPAVTQTATTTGVVAPITVAPAAPVATGGATVTGNERYVDAQGRPLAEGAPVPIEFKRIPVYMKLFMDQREIPSLLMECANSSLPVEVRQLRINPSKGGAVGGRNAPAGGGGRENQDVDASKWDLTVELHGIVYMYNPPDKTKIGVEATGTGTGAVAPVPAEASND